MLIELDNQPAAEVYSQETDLPAQQLLKTSWTMLVGDTYYIFSMHEWDLVNYKRVNKNSTVAIFIVSWLPNA